MRAPGLMWEAGELDDAAFHQVAEQIANVATLPGIVGDAHAMPAAHRGYGFPAGSVAAFDPDRGGVVCAGGVGFDIACGVRLLRAELRARELEPAADALAERLFAAIPAGAAVVGSIQLTSDQTIAMLADGARWAVRRGWGDLDDLARVEERGRMHGSKPEYVSALARRRIRSQLGTLGTGNHCVTVQRVAEIYAPDLAGAFGLAEDAVVVTIHCGSRGLGHQVTADYRREMSASARAYGIELPDPQLACAPIESAVGQAYLGAMRAAINCALANRQIITHAARRVFSELLHGVRLRVLYDLSHNTCKIEEHQIAGDRRRVFVHRRGATRAFGPGHPELPESLRPFGQPVFVPGSNGATSFVLAGTRDGMGVAFGSASCGTQGLHRKPRLARRIADATERAGIARRVARLEPMIHVQG